MDSDFPLVREAHDRNDEILERLYLNRRFTEHLLGDTVRVALQSNTPGKTV